MEYDAGMRASAEATRTAASQLGLEASHPEIIGWSHEMAAWYALTQGRYRDVLAEAEAGIAAAPHSPVAVQLHAQQAKALGRLGDIDGVRGALDAGRTLLTRLSQTGNLENHFVVDPGKFDYYSMDAYRLVRQDDRAAEHAHEVLKSCILPDGTELAPMRLAEARLTLAAVAARHGELDQAVHTGLRAFTSNRRSLPSLTMVAGEVEAELATRYPQEAATQDFQEALHTLRP